MSRQVKLMFSGKMKKWDIIKIASSKQEGIVIGVTDRSGHSCMTIWPYKRRKYKIFQAIWFWWLKTRIFLKIIKVEQP